MLGEGKSVKINTRDYLEDLQKIKELKELFKVNIDFELTDLDIDYIYKKAKLTCNFSRYEKQNEKQFIDKEINYLEWKNINFKNRTELRKKEITIPMELLLKMDKNINTNNKKDCLSIEKVLEKNGLVVINTSEYYVGFHKVKELKEPLRFNMDFAITELQIDYLHKEAKLTCDFSRYEKQNEKQFKDQEITYLEWKNINFKNRAELRNKEITIPMDLLLEIDKDVKFDNNTGFRVALDLLDLLAQIVVYIP